MASALKKKPTDNGNLVHSGQGVTAVRAKTWTGKQRLFMSDAVIGSGAVSAYDSSKGSAAEKKGEKIRWCHWSPPL